MLLCGYATKGTFTIKSSGDCFYTTYHPFGGYKVPRRKLKKPPLTWTLSMHIIGADKREH